MKWLLVHRVSNYQQALSEIHRTRLTVQHNLYNIGVIHESRIIFNYSKVVFIPWLKHSFFTQVLLIDNAIISQFRQQKFKSFFLKNFNSFSIFDITWQISPWLRPFKKGTFSTFSVNFSFGETSFYLNIVFWPSSTQISRIRKAFNFRTDLHLFQKTCSSP